ncbi:DNA-directed RNA polymerase subunit delta [Halalkalibacter urbisdiaboli]|uniref:DNA-directed RNA polymerase subunit delta n=1 Tax=Halalkalibacter urbisdiaboli TaxID=1960589 RepID=UPI000B430E66|nr:DNA-directed RNA polymerase subunit delta [Halalkalibacter urbisdiaboli]
MNLKEMEKEELQELSMVEIAFAIMKEERKPFEYYDLVKRVAEIKGLSKEQVNDRIAYLYTDLNIDGRFLTLGDNQWGLKVWYPLEQAEEEITAPVKPRKKVKDEEVEDLDDDFEDYEDEFEDLEDELDEISSEEDADDDDFDDDDEVEEFDDNTTEDSEEDSDEEVEEDEIN